HRVLAGAAADLQDPAAPGEVFAQDGEDRVTVAVAGEGVGFGGDRGHGNSLDKLGCELQSFDGCRPKAGSRLRALRGKVMDANITAGSQQANDEVQWIFL